MPATDPLIAKGLLRVDRDLRDLMLLFRDVLIQCGESRIAESLPWLSDSAPDWASISDKTKLFKALAMAFQLLNLVEENAAALTRRDREEERGLDAEPALWGQRLKWLHGEGHSREELLEAVRKVRMEPVLTAHPTEAKRAAVLRQLRSLYDILRRWSEQQPGSLSRLHAEEELQASLERLWRTEMLALLRPRVQDELRQMLFYLSQIFPRALEAGDWRFRQAWREAGLGEPPDGPENLPRVRFGLWVGGDRDGHPFVDHAVTRETLHKLRQAGMAHLERSLQELAPSLTLGFDPLALPAEFREQLEAKLAQAGESGRGLVERHPAEPFHWYAELLHREVQQALALESGAVTGATGPLPEQFLRREPIVRDLRLLGGAMQSMGAGRLARSLVDPILRHLDCFGLHLAGLDVRQNSAFHAKAFSQILQAAEVADGESWAEWEEARKLALLREELTSSRPFLLAQRVLPPEAREVLHTFGVLAEHYRRHGVEGLGALIVSMTRSESDLFVVYLFAREAGLLEWTESGWICPLPVVPLLETVDDLQEGSRILDAFLSHDLTQASLEWRRELKLGDRPVQQVMIGYSDSCKDAGILASQWYLHRAQEEIVATGERHGVSIRFFHGRGGTISRGAGPTHRFLDALPEGSVHFDIRVTEQGEAVSQKFAHLESAAFHLEAWLAGTTFASLQKPQEDGEPYRRTLEDLAGWSREAYQALVQHRGFMEFFLGATPIDALEQAQIGSRPSRRTGKRSLEDLRAIPWVFSWNQARFYLPGWYGVGSALERLHRERPEDYRRLKEILASDSFVRYILTNVESSLASADMDMAGRYASLVSHEGFRTALFERIAGEHALAQRHVTELFGMGLSQRRPRMYQTILRRAEALEALHEHQIELLEKWRKARDGGDEKDAERMLPELLLSIHALAGGQRTTG